MKSRTLAMVVGCVLLATLGNISAQSLINIDFGVGSQSAKRGFAATGLGTNDFWNLFRFYDPKVVPGASLVYSGTMADLKLSDGTAIPLSVTVSNAPGVWGNASGDPMYDSYMFAQNGSNITVTLAKLDPGRYNFFLYGHADPDASGEQNSIFRIQTAGTNCGPLSASSSSGWKATHPWQEGAQFVAFRDVEVQRDTPVTIQVSPGANGIAVINGLQIVSKGTGAPKLVETTPTPAGANPTNILIREIRYTGSVNDTKATFSAAIDLESMGTNTISTPLFQGDVAVVARTLPRGVSIVRQDNEYRLVVSAPGVYKPVIDVVARINRAEPWNQITFTGPPAAIASLTATAENDGVELQLLSGTPTGGERSHSRIEGFLNADRLVSLRWQSRGTEIARKALLTAETVSTARIASTVIKFTTALQYEILQAGISQLTIAIPAGQSLTRLQGEQIRDWKLEPTASNQVLSIEFIKPVERSYALALFTEQPTASGESLLAFPQPVGVERESGTLTLFADDALATLGATTGLRQTTSPEGALAAYRFYGRPVSLSATVKRIEPVIKVSDTASVRVQEARLQISHSLELNVEKSGVYAIELSPQTNCAVVEVRGDGVEDWHVVDHKVKISFANQLLGKRTLVVQLEQALKTLPPRIDVLPLHVSGAAKESAQIQSEAVPGLLVKTVELAGLSEIPQSGMLAFSSQENDWKLSLSVERLAPRITAEIFNLATIGDGLVGGCATIRYSIVNQGVQQFRLAVPAHWRNVEFTGANIRSKEQQADAWLINLQDKVWDGYTLVVTYDYQFDPAKASLDAGGVHALDAEHESGSVAVTTAASLKLDPGPATGSLHQIDATELAETDRALITRPVLLAYRYSGPGYQLRLDVTRHAEERGLDAVTDRTQITSVLAQSGEMLTQASFMVKNNDKQFQRFKLPAGARFWGCYVNNQRSKAELDGSWLLVSLPRSENRDEAFAVDLVYAQTNRPLHSFLFPNSVEFQAPTTDVPNTYAEWELYVPKDKRLSGFAGTMSVARGTTYGLHDAFQRFTSFYGSVWNEYGWSLLIFCGFVLFVTGTVIGGIRRGWNGMIGFFVLVCVVGILAAMAVPNFVKARNMSQASAAINNLRQLDAAIQQWALENNSQVLPPTLEHTKSYWGRTGSAELVDPETGEPFTYVGAGKKLSDPNAIIAYSAPGRNGRKVLVGGEIKMMSGAEFVEALEREARGEPLQAQAAVPQSAQVPQSAPQGMGGMGGLGGVPARPNASPRMATGVRSIQIELPRNGQPYTFTKVLNISKEPLSVKISVMAASVYSTARSAAQILTFLAGLFLFRKSLKSRRTLPMTLGLALALGAIIALLISARVLHEAMIVTLPVLAMIAFGLLVIKLLPRKAQPAIPPAGPDTGIPAVAASLIFLLLSSASAIAQDQPTTQTPGPILVSAAYSGTIRETAGQFDGTFQISSATTNQVFNLFGSDIALQDFSVTSGEAKLLRENGRIKLLLPLSGNTVVTAKFLARLSGDVIHRQLAFQLPSALSSRLDATIDEPEADVEFPAAVSFKRTTSGQQTRIEAVIGASDRVDMQWTPRVKRAAETAATVFVENRALVSIGAGVINVRAGLDFQITQGELHQAQVRIPAGHRVLRVEGDSIRTWELKDDNGASLLSIELLKGASTNWHASIETERVLDKLPVTADIEVPHAVGIKRENGCVALRNGDEVTLVVEDARDLQRVDAAEFGSQAKPGELFSVYRFLTPAFHLRVKAETVQPQVEAAVRNRARIASDQVTLVATVDYTIKRAGVFSLKLVLPPDYKAQSVTGTNIQAWTTREEGTATILDVALNNRTIGAYAVGVQLARRFSELPKTIAVPGIHPADVDKLSGVISVSADAGIAVKTSALDGVVEVPAATIGEVNSANTTILGYKLLNTQPSPLPQWKLEVATEALEPWVRAEIADVIRISDSLVTGHAVIRYDIQNAPVREFRLKIPTNLVNVEITGQDIRRRDKDGDQWRVELQNRMNGIYVLHVRWEESLALKTNAMEVVGVQALGVERETGVVVIKAKPPLQVLEDSAQGELMKIDVRETPHWAADPILTGDSAVLCYRYVRPGYRLSVHARRYEEAAVLQALVDRAQFTTAIASDGQVMTEMSLAVRNNGLQHLEVELPAGSEVWSAFVAGQPVRPAKRDGKLLVPLEDAQIGDDAPVSVELTYVGKEKFPQMRSEVTLGSPTFDVPLKNARWDLYLPPDYEYSRFAGTMTHTVETAPVVQTYSLLEYRAQEATRKTSRKTETVSNLGILNRQLESGNTKSLNNAYNQLRNEGSVDETTRRELSNLQSNVRRIQADNLIQAQRNYSGPSQQGLNNYNAEIAQQQWVRLQQAQELAVAKVQPLRINLPTRGAHHAFTQVLQTAVNKPLTVQFFAANTQARAWFRTFILAAAALLALWLAVRSFSRPSTPTAQAR